MKKKIRWTTNPLIQIHTLCAFILIHIAQALYPPVVFCVFTRLFKNLQSL